MQKTIKANFTIESAVILPMIFALLLMLIYWGIYLYNDNTVWQEMYRRGFEGAYDFWKSQEVRKELSKEHLLSLEQLEIYEKEESNYIKIRAGYRMRIPIEGIIQAFFVPQKREYIHEKEIKKIEPVSFIRRCRRMEALIFDQQEGQGE